MATIEGLTLEPFDYITNWLMFFDKTNIEDNKEQRKGISDKHNLDTLAQLRKQSKGDLKTPKENPKDALIKRAKAKYITSQLVLRLVDLNSPLQKSYWNTWHCARILEQENKSLTTKYCNNRWCLVCNRIRTAKQIIGYKKPLSELKEPRFLTLTIPNVIGSDLKAQIELMTKNFKKIKERLRKQGITIKGVRKLECTYNEDKDNFHPHFHIIMSGRKESIIFLHEWLKEYPNSVRRGQDTRPATDDSIIELMKYFTKITPSKESKKDGNIRITYLDTIFQAMQGKRVYQPMGIKKVTEDVENIDKKEYSFLNDGDRTGWYWEQDVNDWIDLKSGECLTDYTPNKKTLNLINKLKDD